LPTSRRQRHPAERKTLWHYRLRGYRILDANAWCGGYELDLVVRRGTWLVFCEVKSKIGDAWGDPLEMVTPEKERRLRAAAESWLVRHPEHRACRMRFDVVAERAGKLERLAHAL